MQVTRRMLVVAGAAAAIGLGGGVASSSALSSASSQDQAAASTAAAQQAPGDVWKRTELYFGTAKPDGTAVTDVQFAAFSDKEITPAFPDGFTRLDGAGQWRGDSGQITRERSHVVIILYSFSDVKANKEIEAIRADYKRQFAQESVLRTDTVERVSF